MPQTSGKVRLAAFTSNPLLLPRHRRALAVASTGAAGADGPHAHAHRRLAQTIYASRCVVNAVAAGGSASWGGYFKVSVPSFSSVSASTPSSVVLGSACMNCAGNNPAAPGARTISAKVVMEVT